MELVNMVIANKWDWRELSKNKAITIQDINSNPYKPWDILGLMDNPSIDIDDLGQEYINRYWQDVY